MRRLFWLGAGIAIGVLVMRRLGKIAQQMTPKGIAGSLGGAVSDLAHELGGFIGDVRSSMSEREQQLREGTGIDTTTVRSSANGANGRGHR